MLDRAKSPEERRKVKRDQLRVSAVDRTDAVRRLRAPESMGHLQGDETADRIAVVKASTTPGEIAKLFVDLPARTRSEIDAPFHGLSTPRRVAIGQKASGAFPREVLGVGR